jgi:ATP/maltotriose-dependent transcriptional regulator MalT
VVWPQSGRDALVEDLRSFLEREQWDDIAILLDDYFFALSLAAPKAVFEVRERAPHEWMQEHPRYRMARELTRKAWRSSALTEHRVEREFADWVAAQERPATRDLLGVKSAEIRRFLVFGRIEEAVVTVEEVQHLIRTTHDHDGFDDVLGSVLMRLGVTHMLANDLDRAVEAFSEGWRWSRSTLPHPIAPYIAGQCALAHALAGDFVHAEEWLARSTEDPSADPRTMAFHLQKAATLTRALIAAARLDRTGADEALAAAAAGVDDGDLWWVDAHVRARVDLYWSDGVASTRSIERALAAYPSATAPASLPGMLLRADLSDILRHRGELDRAGSVLSPVEIVAAHASVVTAQARLLMLRGMVGDALALLDHASARRRSPATVPARWLVIRANAAHLLERPSVIEVTRLAADRIVSTGAHDAIHEAIPAVRARIEDRMPVAEVAADGDVAALLDGETVALTRREQQMLEMMRTHTSVRDLAEALYISTNTAKSHLRNLYRKLGAAGREDALRRAGY